MPRGKEGKFGSFSRESEGSMKKNQGDAELRHEIRQGIREGLEPLRQYVASIERDLKAIIKTAKKLRKAHSATKRSPPRSK